MKNRFTPLQLKKTFMDNEGLLYIESTRTCDLWLEMKFVSRRNERLKNLLFFINPTLDFKAGKCSNSQSLLLVFDSSKKINFFWEKTGRKRNQIWKKTHFSFFNPNKKRYLLCDLDRWMIKNIFSNTPAYYQVPQT